MGGGDSSQETLKVLELFGGIGACSNALRNIGAQFDVVDYVEIDKSAVKSYNAMYDTNFEPQNIIDWDKDIKVDLIMHGSPCQDFSTAGRNLGGDKGSGTRSSLMYETLRIVKKIRPKYVVWENVKAILSDRHRHNFDNYLKEMESLGYINYYKVLDSKDFNVPQHRERLFTISVLGDKKFEFPQKKINTTCVQDILEDDVPNEFYGVCKSMLKALENGKVEDVTNSKFTHTLTTKPRRWNNAGMITDKKGLRYFTPRECYRLMGFSDEDFEKCSAVNPKTELYNQAGNSIVVNVLEEIFKNLLDSIYFNEENK